VLSLAAHRLRLERIRIKGTAPIHRKAEAFSLSSGCDMQVKVVADLVALDPHCRWHAPNTSFADVFVPARRLDARLWSCGDVTLNASGLPGQPGPPETIPLWNNRDFARSRAVLLELSLSGDGWSYSNPWPISVELPAGGPWGLIVGLVAGAVVLVAVIAGVVAVWIRRRRAINMVRRE